MSNRMKLKSMARALSQDDKLRKHIEDLQKALNEMLGMRSPGAYFEPNLESEGEFFVWTPSRRMDLKSVWLLGVLLESDSGMGEQALIRIVERVSKLVPLADVLQEIIPDEQKLTTEEFVIALDNGLIMELRMLLSKLEELPDTEGSAIGMVTSMRLMSELEPLKAKLVSTGEDSPIMLRTRTLNLPVPSPTILLFVLKYVKITSDQDLVHVLLLTGMITQHPLFPEFGGGGLPLSRQ